MMLGKNYLNGPKALLFDVFGTVVDWRSSVRQYLERQYSEKLTSSSTLHASELYERAAQMNWASFAQEWRDSYYNFTRTSPIRNEEDPASFKTVDEHHHESLISLLQQHSLQGFWDEEEIFQISRIWHFLQGWPDSSRGIETLNRLGFQTVTLSNANDSLLSDMAKHAALPWTRILSAEQLGAFKPRPEAYLRACKALGLLPEDCAMVAAHLADLEAASKNGLRTIYIERHQEESWDEAKIREAKNKGWVDIWIDATENQVGGGILEVAEKLDASGLRKGQSEWLER